MEGVIDRGGPYMAWDDELDGNADTKAKAWSGVWRELFVVCPDTVDVEWDREYLPERRPRKEDVPGIGGSGRICLRGA